MSILINLLPDIRQAKLRERRRRQLASGIAVTVWTVCGAVVLLMVIYVAGQKVVISSLSRSINTKEGQLQSVPGLTDALTGEQHLASLSQLYGQRAYMTKFLEVYSAASPTNVSIASMNVDAQNNMVINGTAATYAAVAKLERALEGSNVTVGPNAAPSNTPYFPSVTISSVGTATNGISFTMDVTLGSGVTSGN